MKNGEQLNGEMEIMKKIGYLLIALFVVAFLFTTDLFAVKDEKKDKSDEEEKVLEALMDEEKSDLTSAPLHEFIGQSQEEIIKIFSEPKRIDRSFYGYDWWIYPFYEDYYVQFGISDGKVVTVLGMGDDLNSKPFNIGASYSAIKEIVPFKKKVEAKNDLFVQFELSEEELITKPLIYYEGVWVQLYFDRFTDELLSIRYIDEETLLKQRPYSLTYRGTLPDVEPLTPEEWKEVEKGMAQQIFDITNMIRLRHNLPKLQWHEEAAQVAYAHSKDMCENNYFSHRSPTQGELKDRLLRSDVQFLVAGENIASNYVDALSVVVGWLNSEGHRINLLSEEFTHLGVGVYEKYYTQNFITPLSF